MSTYCTWGHWNNYLNGTYGNQGNVVKNNTMQFSIIFQFFLSTCWFLQLPRFLNSCMVMLMVQVHFIASSDTCMNFFLRFVQFALHLGFIFFNEKNCILPQLLGGIFWNGSMFMWEKMCWLKILGKFHWYSLV